MRRFSEVEEEIHQEDILFLEIVKTKCYFVHHDLNRIETWKHSKCLRCRDKDMGTDPFVLKTDCQFCNLLTNEQKSQLATPTYETRKKGQLISLVDSKVG